MPHALAGRRLLLAEDGEDNQRLISVLLKAAGAEVTVVANGRQALDAIEWAEAGSYGFPLISELARRVEVALDHDDTSIAPLMTRLQAYADAAARGVAAESGAGA
jgi:CheY-like chemotaxis protein